MSDNVVICSRFTPWITNSNICLTAGQVWAWIDFEV